MHAVSKPTMSGAVQPSKIAALRDTMRAAATERTWGQGVTLVRDDRVHGTSRKGDEIELDVRVPSRPAPYHVVLNGGHGEWDCDCSSREKVCSHAAAAVIAVAQTDQAQGQIEANERSGRQRAETALPVSRSAGGTLRYRFAAQASGMTLQRSIMGADGSETVLEKSLISRVATVGGSGEAQRVAAHEHDLTLDQILTSRTQVLTGDKLARVLAVLAPATDVWLGKEKITTSGEEVWPSITIDDDGDGVMITIAKDPTVTKIVCLGVARCKNVIRPIGGQDLQGAKLELVPQKMHVPAEHFAPLVGQTLPMLAKRVQINNRSTKLPSLGGRETPRVDLDVQQVGPTLSVMATLVYGDPARARVDNGKLVHLHGALPIRDDDAEKKLLWRLRDQLNLTPGRKVKFEGNDVFAMNAKLAGWLRGEAGNAKVTAVLDADVTVDGANLGVRFYHEGHEAAPDAVVRAWQAGAEVVPLIGGGWGRLPKAWLDSHGSRLADLLASRSAGGKVPIHALPDLARLCDDLDQPRPVELERLRPLFADFTSLPAADIPKHVAEILRPYQRQGVDWLCFARDAGLGCVLADDMGLGKTVQAIAAMRGRTMVVSPTSVQFNWQDELARFRPELKVATYSGSRRKLDLSADVVVTTYPILRNDAAVLAKAEWAAIFLDEAQAIKNPDSQVARAAYGLKAGWRVTLSGTPVENRLEELWSQLHFTNPGLLGGRVDFRDRWATPITDGDSGAAARLRERIRPFVLRRMKRDVTPELPPRSEAVLHVELDERERAIYDAIRAATQREIVAMLEAGGGVMAALEALLRLRQCACHTALLPSEKAIAARAAQAAIEFDDDEDAPAAPVGDGPVPLPSSKMKRLMGALEDASSEGHKSLVFSQWTSLLDLIEPHLVAKGIPFVRLDGSTRDRAAVVATFQAEGGPPVILLSLKAGGTGLNLTAADHVFLCDPWWNPAVEEQAADRAHRIGQDKPVIVYRLVARDTVEERILALQAKKRGLADAALGEADRATALTRADLLALLA